ncbi:MAG: MoaD/ThiS family protein [Negativicutes bacterium]|nr:MoaD/ThiS family protein [Negativicutes bacterium]
MSIEVRLYAVLRRWAPGNPGGVLTVDLPDGGTCLDLLGKVGINPTEVHVLMVNGVNSPLEKVLHDGDRVGLFPAVGGG